MLLTRGLVRTYGPYLAVLFGVLMFVIPAMTLGWRAAFLSEIAYCIAALFVIGSYFGIKTAIKRIRKNEIRRKPDPESGR